MKKNNKNQKTNKGNQRKKQKKSCAKEWKTVKPRKKQ